MSGRTGIGKIERFDTTDFRVRIGAEVKDFKPEDYGMDRKFVRRNDLFTQYTIAASAMAVADAGIDREGSVDPDRMGVVYGSGIGGIQT
jgi:3-oxoacyl-[acyl-carrier-protein] synthase II